MQFTKLNYIWLMRSAKLSPNHCLNPRTLHKPMALLCALKFSWLLTLLSAKKIRKLKWTIPSCNEGLIILAWAAGPITNHLLTYSVTPCCRVLLEKLTGLQLVKKFPAFHGTRKFFTALTSVHHLSLSWASPIQSIYPHPTSWRSILILSTHLRLGLPNGNHTVINSFS